MSGRKWKAASLAGTLILAWVVGGVLAQAPAAPGKAAAVVNGQSIPLADLEAILKQLGPTPIELPAERKKQMQMQALGLLIDEMLMQQFLSQNAPPVPPVEIEKKLAELVEALKKQNKTLENFCQEAGTTVAAIRKDLASKWQWQAYAKTRIQDADIEKYFKDNKDFFDGVTVRASHIVIRTPQTMPEADRARAQAKLVALRSQILEKKLDFAEAAKNNSECETAPKGGDLGFFPRKMGPEEAFARVAFALPVGQVSDVVQTEYGLHLIKVTDRKEGKPVEFAKIKEEVRELYMEELAQSILAQIHKSSKIEILLP